MDTTKAKESRMRRLAKKHGWGITKSRCRTPEAYEYGGYMIYALDTNAVVHGSHPLRYGLNLEDVEDFLVS